MVKKHSNPRSIQQVMLLENFDFEVKDQKKNQVADHLSHLEADVMLKLGYEHDINDMFVDERVLET